MSVVIGLGIIAFLFMYLAFYLDDKHAMIKVISLIFAILTMMAISSYVLNNQDYCQIVVNSTEKTYVYGDNFTGYHWDYDFDPIPAAVPDYALFHVEETLTYNRVCFDSNTQGSGLSVFKLMNYFVRIIQWYAFVFIIYWLFDFFGFNLLRKAEELLKK